MNPSNNTTFSPSSRAELQDVLTHTNGAPVMIAFVMNGCPACIQLKGNLQHVNMPTILLDVDKFQSLASANGVSRVPTYYIVRYVNGAIQSSAAPQSGGDPTQLAEYIAKHA